MTPAAIFRLASAFGPGRNWQTGVVMGFAIALALQWLGIVP